MSASLSLASTSEVSRRRYPVEYKRQVVQESMVGGASIARVALTHGINANQLHNWRWQYRRGDFGPISQGPVLLPVQLEATPVVRKKAVKITERRSNIDPGAIELIFSAARVVIRGAPDPATLRCIVQALRA